MSYRVQVEVNRFLPTGTRLDIDNHEWLSLADTTALLNGIGIDLAPDDIEALTQYDFRMWEGAGCFKMVRLLRQA